MKNGWEKEIIDPFNELIAPRTLGWKEKWGRIRCEYLNSPDGTYTDVGKFGDVIEEASKLCCMECGRWNGWIRGLENEAARVRPVWRHGWVSTLCQFCYPDSEVKDADQGV